MGYSSMSTPTKANRTSPASGPRRLVDDASLSYGSGIYDLVLKTSRRVLKDLARAEAEFALLLVEEPLVVVAFRFGDRSAWSLAPFVRDRVARDQPPPPEAASDRALVSIIVEQERADPTPVRNFTLSLDFSRALNSAVRDQLSGSRNPSEDSRAFRRLTQKFPSLDSLIARASVRSLGSP